MRSAPSSAIPLAAMISARYCAAPDMSRALARLSVGRGGPRDLAALRDGILAADRALDRLARLEAPPQDVVAIMAALRQPSRDLAREFERALAEQLPLIKRDGGFVREGYDSALDETRNLRDASRLVVAAMQARYADDTGIKGLVANNVLGYFVEVTAQHGDKLMTAPLNATFIHRRTLAGQVRLHYLRTRRDRGPHRQRRRPRAGAGARNFRAARHDGDDQRATICALPRTALHCSTLRPRWQSSRSTTITCGPRSTRRSGLPSRAAGIRWSNRR